MKKILCISMVLMFPFLSLQTSANPITNFKPWETEQVDKEKQGASQPKDADGQQSQDQQAQQRQPQE